MPAQLDDYLEHVRKIPFVRGISVEKGPVTKGNVKVDAQLSIKTPTGRERVYCEIKTSNLSNELAAQIVTLARRIQPLLIVAPVIGSGVGDFLAENKTSFIDLRGNCYLNLGDQYIARIQGQRSEHRATAKALRTPSYQVLFTVLAEPALISTSVRALAASSGVSRQSAVTLRERLAELDAVVETKKGFVWTPTGAKRALDIWLAGYAATVRPSLLIGNVRTQDENPEALEARIAPVLDKCGEWRWGGGAASHRMTGYFRGDRTVVHISDAPSDIAKRLRSVPDRDGKLVLMRSPGPVGLKGSTPDTAHPLLVYSELLTDGGERAREAAQELAERFSIGGAR